MIKDIIDDAVHRMDQAVIHTRMEINKVRTGRANPELVETLRISYYDTLTPLNQLSTISVPEPRLITIHPFDKSVMPDIEKVIMESNLGLTPNNNGEVIHIPIPPLSEERRRDLTKYVHQLTEEGRIAVRMYAAMLYTISENYKRMIIYLKMRLNALKQKFRILQMGI